MEEELEEGIFLHQRYQDESPYTLPSTLNYEQKATEYVFHQMLDQEDGTHVSDVTMTELFDQNQATTDVLDCIVESITQHNTTQHNTTQHNTTQHNTTQ